MINKDQDCGIGQGYPNPLSCLDPQNILYFFPFLNSKNFPNLRSRTGSRKDGMSEINQTKPKQTKYIRYNTFKVKCMLTV